MRLSPAVLALFAAARLTSAQAARVAPPTEVAREADPRRFSEPHLAVHPTDPMRLLATVFSTALAEAVPEMQASAHCSRSWTPTAAAS